MCRLEEWDSMPNNFNNTWGIVRESSVPFVFFISTSFTSVNTYTYFLLFPTQVRSKITDEQKSFIRHVLEIPF